MHMYNQVVSLLGAVLLCSCEEAVEAVGPVAQPPVRHNDQRHRHIRSPLLLQYNVDKLDDIRSPLLLYGIDR